MNLPLQDGADWEIPAQFQHELAEVFQRIKLDDEFRKMRAWLLCNPGRRKTRRGIKRFIGNWLSKAQAAPPPAGEKVTCCLCVSAATMRHKGGSYCGQHGRELQQLDAQRAAQ